MTDVARVCKLSQEKVREVNFYNEGDLTHFNQKLEACQVRQTVLCRKSLYYLIFFLFLPFFTFLRGLVLVLVLVLVVLFFVLVLLALLALALVLLVLVLGPFTVDFLSHSLSHIPRPFSLFFSFLFFFLLAKRRSRVCGLRRSVSPTSRLAAPQSMSSTRSVIEDLNVFPSFLFV